MITLLEHMVDFEARTRETIRAVQAARGPNKNALAAMNGALAEQQRWLDAGLYVLDRKRRWYQGGY